MRKLVKLNRLGILGMLFLFSSILNAEEGFRWEKDFNTAVQKATENNQLVLVHFYGNHCPPCRKMDRDIFSRSDLYQTLADYFVPIKVDTNENLNAVKSLEIVSIPTDIIVTPQGRIIYRRVGGATPEQYLSEILAIAEQYYRNQLQQQGEQSGQQPAQQANQNTLQQNQQLQQQGQGVQEQAEPSNWQNPLFSGESLLDHSGLLDNKGPTMQPQSPLTSLQTTEPYDPLQSEESVETDPFQTSLVSTETLPERQPAVVQAGSIPIHSTVATQAYVRDGLNFPNLNTQGLLTQEVSEEVQQPSFPTSSSSPSISTSASPSTSSSPSSSGPIPSPTVFNYSGPENIPVTVQPVSNETVPAINPITPQPVSNDSAPNIMYEGYCPVELQNNKHWVLGSAEWTLHYGGADYVFSGKEAMQTFARDPHRYIPVLLGSDVVATLREHKRMPGVRKYGGWFQDRIYLFSSRENYDLFVQNPAYYAEHAEKLEPNSNSGLR
ncbi:MAG: thioredoxin domain-containing protein [Thermoguttaceae bacterium]